MALLSKQERQVIKTQLTNPYLTEDQRDSLLRELKADDESVSENSVDTKMALSRKP